MTIQQLAAELAPTARVSVYDLNGGFKCVKSGVGRNQLIDAVSGLKAFAIMKNEGRSKMRTLLIER